MVDDHKHCIVCGKATAPDKVFCSPSCEELFKAQQKKMKKSRTIMLVMFVMLFILMFVVTSLRGGTAVTSTPAAGGWNSVDSWLGTL